MYFNKCALVFILLLLFFACKKPTENIKVVLDTDIIKHTAMIYVTDAATGIAAPGNTTIKILGAAAANVYELSGKKDIRLTGGMVTIGLQPDLSVATPVNVVVEISSPGYNTNTKQITFTENPKQQVINIALTRIGSTAPPIVSPPPPVFNNTTLTFTGKCPNRNDLEVRPSVYIYFKKSGSNNPYQYLGYMNKGKIETNLLQINETYEFQIVYGGESYRVAQKIEQTNYNLTIDMPAACNF